MTALDLDRLRGGSGSLEVSASAAGRSSAPVGLLLAVFAGAVVVRVALAGTAGARSTTAGLAFAALLAAVCVAVRVPTSFGWRALAWGVVGAVVLVVPVALTHSPTAAAGTTSYVGWALATAVVATAEEAFLRGALFDAALRRHGPDVAVVVAAVAFAALHVPLYGWHVVPLDLAVGLGLGALRLAAGTWTAPAVAHVGADLVGWWFL
jgi:membrane protease YdiL (CAAX protease family)